MKIDDLAKGDIFETRFHNPSIFSVRSRAAEHLELVDFCVPANSYFPPAQMLVAIKENLTEILKYYPDYLPVHQDNIAKLVGTPADCIIPANGVTELITMLCQSAQGPILTDVPTFGRWTDLPLQYGTPIEFLQRAREVEFVLTVDEIVSRVAEVNARTLIISNPNNPTGACNGYADMDALLSRLEHLHLVVIDESFIDFSGIQSAESLALKYPNVVVVKSMGKALGWHGIRLGYGVANPLAAQALRDKVPYWNINGLAAFVLKHAWQHKQAYLDSFKKVALDRDYMFGRLGEVCGLRTYPSKANFLLSELPEGVSGKRLRNVLLEKHGVFVRECSNKVGSDERFLRNVVRKKPEVDRLVAALLAELGHADAGAHAAHADTATTV